MPDELNDVLNRFSYHSATDITGPMHDEMRTVYMDIVPYIFNHLPPSREASLALTTLQESLMWANAAIAIHNN